MTDQTATHRMVENASVVIVRHQAKPFGKLPSRWEATHFRHEANPAIPVGKPKPPGMLDRVWVVWIEGRHTYLRARGRTVYATFDTFHEAYLAALEAGLVPEIR